MRPIFNPVDRLSSLLRHARLIWGDFRQGPSPRQIALRVRRLQRMILAIARFKLACPRCGSRARGKAFDAGGSLEREVMLATVSTSIAPVLIYRQARTD